MIQPFKYSIIIPTYNHCDDLLKPCVESILAHTSMSDVELIISANGCVDETKSYVENLIRDFTEIGFPHTVKLCWNDEPLGYAKACNSAIHIASADRIVLLNNDCVLLSQPTNSWLEMLDESFTRDAQCGISCVIKGICEPVARDFAMFFCVMIHKKVFDKIGLLNTDYGVGGGEDVEFSIEAERAGFHVNSCVDIRWIQDAKLHTGAYPIHHYGERTMYDTTLVSDYKLIVKMHSKKLAAKYNPQWLINNP
jgi:GT2 family glycosyltransferase